MLTTLRIKNLALAADVTVEFHAGFNAVTGETGAGKSILIGALSLVLGERADRTLIRAGSENCTVEAVFEIGRLRTTIGPFLEANGLESCEDNQLVLKRTFTTAGTNRQFVNGSPTTLSVLASLGEWLVDIHGPHDHQSLLHSSRQLAILDAYGRLESERTAFASLVARRSDLENQKALLIVDERTYAQQLDLLRFQSCEIAAAQLRAGEDQQLEEDYRRALNASKLIHAGQTALNLLADDDQAVLAQAGAVGKALAELAKLDDHAVPLLELHRQATSLLGELNTELGRYLDRIEVDPQRLQQLEERLNLIQSLKRKYGATVEEVIGFGASAEEKLRKLEQREVELERLRAALTQVESELWRAGQDLTARRRKLIPALCKAATKELADLGFKNGSFDISLTSVGPTEANASDCSPQGLDKVDFQFAPNVGEPKRPLRSIASSGEMARAMLALKTVLAAEDSVPVLVFDEVDANVGGETAYVVGEKMRRIGKARQVLCITHLAPVAASAATHFVVSKQVKGGRTISDIARLDPDERLNELARMLGGQSDAARKHAEAMLEEARH